MYREQYGEYANWHLGVKGQKIRITQTPELFYTSESI